MIASIPAAWQTNLKTGGQTDRDERVYIDFRGKDYPDVARDTEDFIDRGNCESATPPTVRGETADTNSNTTFAQSTAQVRNGSNSFLLTKTVAAGTEGYTALQDNTNTNDMHGFLAGETVDLVAWVYVPSTGGPAASEVTLRVQEYYSASWNATTIDTAAGQNAWEALSGRIVLNDATAGLRIEVVIASTAANNEFCYFDDIAVYRFPTFTLARESNLIDRGNCESTTPPALLGDTTATTSNATWARSTEQKRSGDYSYKHTKTAGAAVAYAALHNGVATGTLHGIVPGETVEVECYVYVPTTGGPSSISEVFMSVEYYDASEAAWQTTQPAATTYDEWHRLSASVTLSMDATGFRVLMYQSAASAAGEYYYADDIIVKRHSVPGSHYLSGGYTEHLVTMPDTFTFQIKFKSGFAYDTASNQWLASWYVSATQELRIYYLASSDAFTVLWEDGGTNQTLLSAQYDDGSSFRNINQWITLTAAIDLTTGTTAGSALWLDKTQDDTTWSGAIDAKSTTFNKLQIRAYNGTAGDFDIAYVRMFPNYVATDADVQADFKTVLDEEIYWSLDGHANGETRCKISATQLIGLSFERGVANRLSGAHSANQCAIALNNLNGEFSDDQYAAFDPANEVYNGTVAQKYLQRRCRVRVEDWYSGDFDNVFVGRLSSGGFSRQSTFRTISKVGVVANDRAEQLATRHVEYSQYFEDYKISQTNESASLMHVIPRLGLRRRVKQYLGNNSFEDATITDAWTASGGTWSRQANPLFATYCGRLVPGAGNETVSQTVTFTGTEKLSVGQSYNFSIWVLSSAAAASDAARYIQIGESDAGGSNDTTSTSIVLAGGEGFLKHEVTHTITDSDSDRLVITFGAKAGDTFDFDGAMLVNGDRALNFFQEESTITSSSGSSSADLADVATYDTCGFDVDPVDITHPWKRVEEGEGIKLHVDSLATAVLALYSGFDENGTYRLRCVLADGYTDYVPYQVFAETDILPGINTNLTMAQGNKLTVRGARIIKDSYVRLLWSANATRSFDLDEIGQLSETVSNGNTWPSPTTYGEYWAVYDGQRGEILRQIEEAQPEQTALQVALQAFSTFFAALGMGIRYIFTGRV